MRGTQLRDLVIQSYILHHCEPEHVMLERVEGFKGPRWCIRQLGCCFNKQGEWEREPMPSSRTDAFFRRCRWNTPEDALKCWDLKNGTSRFIAQFGSPA